MFSSANFTLEMSSPKHEESVSSVTLLNDMAKIVFINT